MNVKISNIEMIDKMAVKGTTPNASNKATVTSALTASAICVPLFKSLYNAVPPNTAIQTQAIAGGTTITPVTNSRMVLPLDTRATNAPTNGDHAMAHAQ